MRISLFYNQGAGEGESLNTIRKTLERQGHTVVQVVKDEADLRQLLAVMGPSRPSRGCWRDKAHRWRSCQRGQPTTLREALAPTPRLKMPADAGALKTLNHSMSGSSLVIGARADL